MHRRLRSAAGAAIVFAGAIGVRTFNNSATTTTINFDKLAASGIGG